MNKKTYFTKNINGDKMEKNRYRILVGCLIVLFLFLGMFAGYITQKPNISNENTVVNNKNNEDDEKNNVNTNSEIDVYKTYEVTTVIKYSKCDDVIEDTKEIDILNIDEYINEMKKEYEVSYDNDKKIKLIKEIEGYSNNYYIVKLVNNEIIVYRLQNQDEMVTKIDVHINLVRKEILNKIKEGYIISNDSDLEFFIEDLES